MEDYGAVFLPFAGWRQTGSSISFKNTDGANDGSWYWSSSAFTLSPLNGGHIVRFYSGGVDASYATSTFQHGCAVRLCFDVQ